MPFSQLPTQLASWLEALTSPLDKRSAPRFLLLLLGALFAKGRRTVTSWFRAAGITAEFRHAYNALSAAGRAAPWVASRLLRLALAPLMARRQRLVFAIDDTPTPRWGPWVQGAGIHHNPAPGPAGEKFLYGHVWVTLAWLAPHSLWGVLALPLWALLYVRKKDVPELNAEAPWAFRTKLELAVELVRWLLDWLPFAGKSLWLAVDGFYAKRPVLKPLKAWGVTVVSRLRKDADLRDVPPGHRPKGRRGPRPTYGKNRISLAKRAGQKRGWRQVECVQYGRKVSKKVKAFEATWRPAGGAIGVVLVSEEGGWVAFFCTDVSASVVDVLEAAAARAAIEQTFKDVKEVWGAGQQQVRNVYANSGAFNVNLWMYGVVEAWAWDKDEEELVDRSRCPWDREWRRPSHADKRKALQRQILAGPFRTALGEQAEVQEFHDLIHFLLQLAA